MKIKERENVLLMLFKIIKGARFKHWVLLGTVSLFSFIMLIIGAMSQRYGYVEIAKQSIINVRGLPLRYLKGLASRPEKLYISTKHKNYNKLAEDRINAIKQGFLISDSEDYVPASIKYNNIAYDVKMRLKGIWLDNLEGDKWSLRVKVKNSKTIMGMRVFSLQHPQVRNYIYEWIYQEALRNEGIIALRYKFIEVILNGKNLGIFALEEHMNKRLIENNQLKEGSIIRFSDKIN